MTDTTNIVGGVDSYTIDGRNYGVSGDASYRVSGLKNTTEVGSTSVDGFSVTPEEGFIEVVLRNNNNLDLQELADVSNATVVLGLANGKMVIARNAWRDGSMPSPNPGDGKFTYRISGKDIREV